MKITNYTNFDFLHCLEKYQDAPVAVSEQDCNLLWVACDSLKDADHFVKLSFYEMLLKGYFLGEKPFGDQNKFRKLVKRFRELCPDDWQHFEQVIISSKLEQSMSGLNCG